MKQLYIDFDGVILNTVNFMNKDIEDLKIQDDFEKKEEYYKNIDWDKMISQSSEINNSIENIKKLIESKFFNISILTHMNSLEELIYKTKFIRKSIKEIPIIGVPKVFKKPQMVNAKDAILVDDRIENIIDWKSSGGIAIQFLPDKKTDLNINEINNLEQLIEIFK
ncbi:MAG: hypothetical protein ACK5HP_01835 [Bacilli bacterium]